MKHIRRIWDASLLGKLAVVGVALIVTGCGCCGLITLVSSLTPGDDNLPALSAPTVEQLSTAAPVPTIPTSLPDTPIPTFTTAPNDVLPTDAPAPTDPPSNSAFDEPDELEYGQGVVGRLALLSGSAINMQDLINAAIADPSLLNDPEWRFNVHAEASLMRLVYDSHVADTPPESWAEVHDVLEDAFSDCADGGEQFADAIDNMNDDDLSAAMVLIVSCGTQIEDANIMISEMPQ